MILASEKIDLISGVATDEDVDDARKYATNYITEDAVGDISIGGNNSKSSSVEIGDTVKVKANNGHFYTEMKADGYYIKTDDGIIDNHVTSDEVFFGRDGFNMGLLGGQDIYQMFGVEIGDNALAVYGNHGTGTQIIGSFSQNNDPYPPTTPLSLYDRMTDKSIDVWDSLNDMFKTYSPTFTAADVAASSYTGFTATNNPPSGYTPIAIINVGTGTARCCVGRASCDYGTNHRGFINVLNLTSTKQSSVSPSMTVLCVKAHLLG